MDKDSTINNVEWKGRTGGNLLLHKMLIGSFKWCNIRVFYAIMAIIVPFYMLINHKGYLSTYHYFRERFNYSVLKSFCSVYLNHYRFGQIILDRFATYAGKKFNIEIENIEIFNDLINGESGFMQLSSHVGNYELAGYSLKSKKKRINALVFANEVESVMNNRNRLFLENNMLMIPVKDDMSHIFLMNNALVNGEVLSIPADRIFGSSKSFICNFLGKDAKFPMGPFILAAQRNVPVISIFVMKESVNNYKLYIKTVSDSSVKEDNLNIKTKAKVLAENFAKQLDDIVRTYPLQWFNYYEFWK